MNLSGVSATASGWLSDRWIAKGQNPTCARKTFMGVGMIGAGVFLALCVAAASTASVVFLLVASVSYGMCASNVWAITQTLAGSRAAGKWTGLQNFVGNMAGVVAPALTGLVVDRTGRFLWAFAITGAVAAAGSLVWIFLAGPVKPVPFYSTGG